MASPTNVNLQPVTFQQLADNFYANYIVNPYDINGNVIGSQILEIVMDNNPQQVTLPLISSLEPSNYELTLVNVDGTDKINVLTSGTDKIGDFLSPFLISQAGATVTFSVATNGIWTLQKLAAKL
jgi:nitrous oxide reductase